MPRLCIGADLDLACPRLQHYYDTRHAHVHQLKVHINYVYHVLMHCHHQSVWSLPGQ